MATDNPGVQTGHIRVSRNARYSMLGSISDSTRELWIVCHGYAQLAARFIRRFEPIAESQRAIVAPEALSRFYAERAPGEHSKESQVGASWMTAEDRESEIADYIGYLDVLAQALLQNRYRDKVTLRVLGFSQGTATVARWIANGKTEPDQVILWAGGVPPELDAAHVGKLAAQSPLIIVAAKRDEFIPWERTRAEVARIAGLGVRHELIEFDGTHDIDAATLTQVARTLPARG